MDYINLSLQILTVLILVGYTFLLIKSRLNPKIVKWAAAIITLAGTFVFMYGYQTEGYQEGWVTLFLRGFFASIKMFLYENSAFESLVAQKSNPYFLDCFIIVYYGAILTSTSAIILLFGKRVKTFFVLTFGKKKFRHVFFGVNKNSQMIAKGIKDEEIAFIEFPGDGNGDEISLSNIINNMTADDKDSRNITGKHVTLLRAKRRLAQRDTEDGVLEDIGLAKLQRRIDANTSFYLLSDDEERNLEELLVVVSDESLRYNTTHACVKREGLGQTYNGVLGKTGAHLIYPSSLSVVDLMKSPDCHPIHEMAVNTDAEGRADGTVSGEFNALIIGFGETGQATTRFLYEFTSAIRKDGTPLPLHIYINDKRLGRLKSSFMFTCPEVEHDDIITYENTDLDSSEFWKKLISRLDSLNYIEISLGNDTANLNLACTIYGYAEKRRKNGFDNFRIYVRKKITPPYEKRLVRRLNEKAGQEVIRCFGEYDKIFTREMIVSKDFTGINVSATALVDKLQARYADISGNSKSGGQSYGETPGSFHEKKRIRRETHQFISRANHITTKLMLVGWDTNIDDNTLENMAKTEHLRYSRYLKAHGYTYEPEDDDVMKTNHQICTWEQLSEEDKQYHRNMVLASFATFEN